MPHTCRLCSSYPKKPLPLPHPVCGSLCCKEQSGNCFFLLYSGLTQPVSHDFRWRLVCFSCGAGILSLLWLQHFESTAVGLNNSVGCSARLADTPQAMRCSVFGREETIVMFKCLLYCSEDNNSPNTLQTREEDYCLSSLTDVLNI